MKKIVASLLALVMVFSLFACSKSKKPVAEVSSDYVFTSKDYKGLEIGTPDKPVDHKKILENLKLTPEMLYGTYCLKDIESKDADKKKAATDAFNAQVQYVEDKLDAKGNKISSMPYKMVAGEESFDYGLKYETKYHWISLTFLTDSGYLKDHQYAYEIKDNKLILTGVDWEYDNKNKKLEYKLLDDVRLEYALKLRGMSLTISAGESSVELFANLTVGGEESIHISHYLTEDSPKLDSIDSIRFLWKDGKAEQLIVSGDYTNEAGYNATKYADEAILAMDKDGLLKLTYTIDEKTYHHQFAYIYCDDDGMILLDGSHTYAFTDTYAKHMKNDIGKNVDISQMKEMDALSESDLEQIEKKKTDLTADLTKAFNDAGIKVSVDKKTGEVAMDAAVLFGGDSAEITDEGKAFLDKFIKAYSTIISDKKYDGFISKTLVEGHIAPVEGVTYESGLPFSEKRAQNVMEYCLGSKEAVNPDQLKKTMEAVGFSNSKPILDENGEVDFDASRRVSFRFMINLKKA